MGAFYALIAIRLITFVTAMLLFGSSLFALYAPHEAMERSDARPRTAGIPRGAALGSGVLLLVSVFGWLFGTAASLNDEGNPLPMTEMIRTMLFDTGLGRVWVVQLGLTLLLLGGVLTKASSRVILVLAAAALASQAWIGHAAMGTGLQGILRLGTMVIHLLAAGAWLGSLVPLGSVLLAARRAGQEPALVAAGTALRRFSRMGYVAVGLLLLSGSANTSFLVGSAGAFSRAYGSVLVVKLVLATVLLSLALANRILLSRFDEEEHVDLAALSALRRNVLLEQLVGLLVLGAVSVLGLLPPGRS
jgi:putative copper resistance protein D